MDLKHSFTFGGVNTANYGIFISGEGVYNSPERDVTMLTVPGRNGQLTIDNGRFENIEVTYPCFIEAGTGATDISARIRAFRNAIGSLTGYQRLEDTYHNDEYRQGIFKAGLNVDPVVYHTGGEFEVTFDCKPQRWLIIPDDPIPADNSLILMGRKPVMPSYPLLMVVYKPVQSSFPLALQFASYYDILIDRDSTQTPNSSGNCCMYIDCELMEAYEYAVNTDDNVGSGAIISCNSRVMVPRGFPVIPPNYPDASPFMTGSAYAEAVYMYRRLWRL